MPHILAKCKFASLCGASAEPFHALNVSILFSINKCFAQDSELLFGSAALVGQVQVCILAHQQSPAEPVCTVVLDKQIP